MSDFSPEKIINDNLSVLNNKAALLTERRITELYEASMMKASVVLNMLQNEFGIYEALSVISLDISFGDSRLHEDCMPENAPRIRSFLNSLCAFDKACFVSLFLEALRARGVFLNEESFFDNISRDESFALVKGQLAAEAYDVFALNFKAPRLKYAKDLRAAVKMLVSGEVGYAILPLEEEGGVRLSSVSEMLFRDDLRISSVTVVFGTLGNADMKYALVSKAVDIPPLEIGDDRYLEIRIKAEEKNAFSDIISASSFFGTSVYRVNTISFLTEDGEIPYYSIVFKKDAGDFLDMLTYLAIFIQDFTAVGIYKNLE